MRLEKGKNAKREIFWAQVDMVRMIVDSFYAYCFFEEAFMAKKTIGLMGIMTSVMALADGFR